MTVPGVRVSVLNYDDSLELRNGSRRTVTVLGYRDEPYARILADGTVQVNRRSPATYLNDDRYADVRVPKSADPKARPRWTTRDRTGRFAWHDHRSHWMGRSLPPQVKDEGRRTKVFDWSVPLAVAGGRESIRGTLVWVGEPSDGFPLGAAASLGAAVLLGGALVVVVRRRRRGGGREGAAEAW